MKRGVLSLLRQCEVHLILSGKSPRALPVWPVASMLLVHSGTVNAADPRLPHPAYNLIEVEAGRISIELCVLGGERRTFSAASGGVGDYPRDWPKELSARQADLFVRA